MDEEAAQAIRDAVRSEIGSIVDDLKDAVARLQRMLEGGDGGLNQGVIVRLTEVERDLLKLNTTMGHVKWWLIGAASASGLLGGGLAAALLDAFGTGP